MNDLSPDVLAQIYSQESDDPFLTLVTLTHPSFSDPIRLVNNTVDVTSRGDVYSAFPMKVRFPVDDGESARDFTIDFDNASLELIAQIRQVTTQIKVKIEMILFSMPDAVQISQDDLYIATVTYSATKITARIVLDNFLNTQMTSEQYNPSNFPGIYG